MEGGGTGLEDLEKLPYVNAVLAESLRMYPQPPILIRRALADDTLPCCLNGDPEGYPIGKGADLFISVWNLHRCAPPAPHPARTSPSVVPGRFLAVPLIFVPEERALFRGGPLCALYCMFRWIPS